MPGRFSFSRRRHVTRGASVSPRATPSAFTVISHAVILFTQKYLCCRRVATAAAPLCRMLIVIAAASAIIVATLFCCAMLLQHAGAAPGCEEMPAPFTECAKEMADSDSAARSPPVGRIGRQVDAKKRLKAVQRAEALRRRGEEARVLLSAHAREACRGGCRAMAALPMRSFECCCHVIAAR